ncbi:DUF6879 family protein [Nocardia cyriacigeorgica]|uniref:DUF6879 family protein n=1 Tax=Nocardia cyriacigeorgica TaxID=135487 RepID=UPI001893F8D8|nr:DUF6879 family protein [Nocardia cyriacigeorgica]MBF6453562.1 hypothetical protein [Nocardia cyriacigeorgica]MBF6479894.1 hypothetical protein [Nocardia cyriacigeorgica]MBF6550731.1 hypothetical protein [Nocardia cyriacigeorgica]
MAIIGDGEFDRLLTEFAQSAVHLETRDAYGTEIELPHMAKWTAGEPDDLVWLGDWCENLRRHAAAGRSIRRARIVSEPLSTYQRWSHSIAQPMVDAGEDIRWVPRRRLDSVAIPGNDFYLIDNELVIFLHYSGDGLSTEKVTSTEPGDIDLCRTAFEAVWQWAIPHRDYQPV